LPVFSYRAVNEGNVLEGAIEAPDERAAIEKLKDAGMIPIQVAAPKENADWTISLKSKQGDLVTFTTELSALLNAGLPLDRSLNILAGISEKKEMKRIISDILKSIREGGSFSGALQLHPKIFPPFYINMIRAGEAGGVLEVILDKLNEYLESTRELKENIVSAMIYPIILIVTGGLSIILLLTFVLPRFSQIFSELGESLPLSTQILITTSAILKSYWWVGLLTVTACWLTFRNYIKSEKGRYRWDDLKLRWLGDLISKLETARFCRTLGTLLQSGVPLIQSLNNAKDVIGNSVIASTIDDVSKGAKEGQGISAPLAAANVFPPLAVSMIRVGEETGQLDVMLIKVAATFERILKQTVKKFVSLMEPVLILIMGLVIGSIVVSMLMAIFSITDIPF
jgi:general secretion pathway protein F